MRGVPWLVLGALSLACQPEFVTNFGETVIRVSTNLPMPRVANRVRVDVYIEDASLPLGLKWTASREFAVRAPTEVPLSFSILTNREQAPRSLVRMRVYDSGLVRDYLGERYTDTAAPTMAPTTDGPPRLLEGSADISPTTEPLPAVAIDRLVWVTPKYGEQTVVDLFLEAQCSGTMANLAMREACKRVHGTLEAAGEAVGESASEAPARDCSAPPRPAGTADGKPLYDDEVCVPGGIYLMGTADVATLAVRSGTGSFSSYGVRVAEIPPLLMDRYEVTVGRWRAALAAGFVPPRPRPDVNDRALPTRGTPSLAEFCTYSEQAMPDKDSRESFPLNCVSGSAARAFCQFYGGDLPTEAQWEWVATSAGLGDDARAKRVYPWGDSWPNCDTVVFGRAPRAAARLLTSGRCVSDTIRLGPAPVDQGAGDFSPAVGVYGLGGNVRELVRDVYNQWLGPCWTSPAWENPWCDRPGTHALRGGAWIYDEGQALAVTRAGNVLDAESAVGFRCVRPGR